jgi:hypothetical protein
MAKGTKSLHHSLSVDDDQNLFFYVNVDGDGSPPDGDIADGEAIFYIDVSGADPVVKMKVRNGASVISGDVATLT